MKSFEISKLINAKNVQTCSCVIHAEKMSSIPLHTLAFFVLWPNLFTVHNNQVAPWDQRHDEMSRFEYDRKKQRDRTLFALSEWNWIVFARRTLKTGFGESNFSWFVFFFLSLSCRLCSFQCYFLLWRRQLLWLFAHLYSICFNWIIRWVLLHR